MGRCLIDAGYVPDTVYLAIRRSGRVEAWACHGAAEGEAGTAEGEQERNGRGGRGAVALPQVRQDLERAQGPVAVNRGVAAVHPPVLL